MLDFWTWYGFLSAFEIVWKQIGAHMTMCYCFGLCMFSKMLLKLLERAQPI